MRLHNYFRSSASYRVRIALNLKGLPYDYRAVHLSRDGGEQFAPAFRALNPQALVPVLEDDEQLMNQSLAIMEYLDEAHPEPPLLPKSVAARAYVRAVALTIACEIHPLNNLRVLDYLTRRFGATEDAKLLWYQHWVGLGLSALEAQIGGSRYLGKFCHEDTPSIADCCLVPQLFNARRFECDLSPYPTLLAIDRHCHELAAFQRAAPERQPDANG
jgi:maleylacetoacetate isomerase